MSNSIKVSNIVPVYNAENYLDRCINSIKRQTSHEWETIIVNDGSTDGSLERLRTLSGQDSRFRIICKKNGGAATARNVGINAARTEYITFVDADDSIEDRHVECMLDKLDEEHCDLVISRLRKNGLDLFFPFTGFHKFEPYSFFKYFDGGPCAKLFKKEIIDKYNIRFPEDMKVAEDYVFFASYAIHITSFFQVKHRDFKQSVGLLRRLLLPVRYPRLRRIGRQLKRIISSVKSIIYYKRSAY